MTDDFIGGDDDVFDPVVAQEAEDKRYETQVEFSSEVQAHLQRAKQAYTRVFVECNGTKDDVAFVMHDLAWFCSAFDSLWDVDPRAQDRKVARRDVYQRIVEHSRLDFNTLMKRYIETQG